MNGINLAAASDIRIGSTQVSAVYLGANKIWPVQHDYSQDWLTIVSLEDNNEIKFVHQGNEQCTILVSTDTGSVTAWYNKTASSTGTLLATLNTGDKLLLKGNNNTYTLTTNSNRFISTKSFNLEGNIMSLIYGNNFVGQTTLPSPYINTFMRLFKSSYVVSAEHLILPATTLVDYCYTAMFEGCTSLTTAPELPATTLVDSCYYGMFNGCSSLNYIKCLATDISATNCTNWWVDNVAATGTFIKDPNMTSWTTGTSGIPSGWTIQNA